MINTDLIGKNIRYLRKRDGYKQDYLADYLGLSSYTSIQKWESGVSTPPLGKFIMMAELFNVSLDDFAKCDLSAPVSNSGGSVPIYDHIPAGVQIEDLDNNEGYIEISGQLSQAGKDFFALRVSGDSMSPKYRDGDIVLFERQNTCANDSDVAVRINRGDAMIKKYHEEGRTITLNPINKDHSPIQVGASDESAQVEIIGVAVELRRKV